jgi:hypothetical protein
MRKLLVLALSVGSGLVLLVLVVAALWWVSSGTPELPPPAPPPAPGWTPDYIPPAPWRDGYGLGDDPVQRRVALCAAQTGIPPQRGATLTPEQSRALMACVDRWIQEQR